MKQLFFLVLFLSVFTQGRSQSSYLVQGIQAMDKEDYDQAFDHFTSAINEKTDAPSAYYWRGLINYYFRKKPSEAMTDVSKSILLLGKKENGLKSMAYQLRGRIFEYLEDGTKALDDYNMAVKLTPKSDDAFMARGKYFLNAENYPKAKSDFDKVLELSPSDEAARIGIGRIYTGTKEYDQAKSSFDEAIRLNEENADAFYYRSENYYVQGKYDDAISDMFQSYLLDGSNYRYFMNTASKNIPLAVAKVSAKINEQPSSRVYYFVRARLYEENNQYPEAIKDYRKINELSDGDEASEPTFNIGRCYFMAGAYDRAIGIFESLLIKDSTKAVYYGWRGLCLMQTGKRKEAEKDLTRAIELDPEQYWFYQYRGDLRYPSLQDKKGALNDLTLAVSMEAESYSTLLLRARLYLEGMNQPDKAKADLEKILQADSTDVRLDDLLQAYFFSGRVAEAKQKGERLLQEDPSEYEYRAVARLCLLMKQNDRAIALLKEAFEKGFYQFELLLQDRDFQVLTSVPAFQELITGWKAKRDEMIAGMQPDPISVDEQEQRTATIPMQPKGSGTYEVSCKINGLSLNMIFDTGASDISISQTEVQFMLKNGYLSKSDFVGSQRYIDANGDVSVGATLLFRKVEFGGLVLKNVKASVVNNKNAPLLFGQSALSKYGKIVIDNEKKMITIGLK